MICEFLSQNWKKSTLCDLIECIGVPAHHSRYIALPCIKVHWIEKLAAR